MTYNNFIEVPRLNYIQIEGVKAGLSREQVQTPNFC